MSVHKCTLNEKTMELRYQLHGFIRIDKFTLAQADPFRLRIKDEKCLNNKGPKFVFSKSFRKQSVKHITWLFNTDL